ncbi:MAG: RAMP superfamily CRISPR-associated protein [Chloroflexota bacterium]
MTKLLKGEGFLNRYRFTGTLCTLSPLHIGTGEAVSDKKYYSADELKEFDEKKQEIPKVSTVIRGFNKKPLIPGSTLRGVTRHWLLSVLSGFGEDWAASHDYEDKEYTEADQDAQIAQVKEEFSWLELLFGTPLHEGKIEFWDAVCTTNSIKTSDKLLGWDPETLTYVDTSVAIDPRTGTAVENLLYKAEVVPPGVEFEFNLVGQNLSDFEIGLVLMALQGFNSEIYPIEVGARSGRGYGRVQFTPGLIYGLDADQLSAWASGLLQSFGDGANEAGYFALPQLSPKEQQSLLQRAKSTLRAELEHNDVQS